MDLKGAVALVTGSNGGLGQRICYALAASRGVRRAKSPHKETTPFETARFALSGSGLYGCEPGRTE